MKDIFTAAAFGLLAYVLVVLLCIFVAAVGLWLYGWQNDGAGYFLGAVMLGPVAATATSTAIYLELKCP